VFFTQFPQYPFMGVIKSACAKEPRGLTGRYRWPGFISTASAAKSFRSRCGSWRRAPVDSSQASSVAAPQVGQGTDTICFQSEFLSFHRNIVQFSKAGKCSILLIFNTLAKRQIPFWVRQRFLTIMNKDEHLC
jgi:hypothetical protein